jgi:hypothetical protein
MSRYINNKRSPDPEFLIKLAEQKVNLNWLLSGEGGMYVSAPWDPKPVRKSKSMVEVVSAKGKLSDCTDSIYSRTILLPILADISVCAVRLNDGITLKRIQFYHQRQQVLLHPFNAEYRVQVVDSMQGDDISLIGTMVMQLRLS